MKILPLSLMACFLTIVLPRAGSSQDTVQSPLHLFNDTESARVRVTADSIVRENPPVHGSSNMYSDLTRLKGHVEIRTCCVVLPTGNQQNPPRAFMILQADEADYHEQSGEIEPRGAVRITFQKGGY